MPFKIGESIFIRTVTMNMTGRIKAITGKFITLEDAAWIADSGRFHDALAKGTLSEVEPIPGDMRVNSDTFVDVLNGNTSFLRSKIMNISVLRRDRIGRGRGRGRVAVGVAVGVAVVVAVGVVVVVGVVVAVGVVVVVVVAVAVGVAVGVVVEC